MRYLHCSAEHPHSNGLRIITYQRTRKQLCRLHRRGRRVGPLQRQRTQRPRSRSDVGRSNAPSPNRRTGCRQVVGEHHSDIGRPGQSTQISQDRPYSLRVLRQLREHFLPHPRKAFLTGDFRFIGPQVERVDGGLWTVQRPGADRNDARDVAESIFGDQRGRQVQLHTTDSVHQPRKRQSVHHKGPVHPHPCLGAHERTGIGDRPHPEVAGGFIQTFAQVHHQIPGQIHRNRTLPRSSWMQAHHDVVHCAQRVVAQLHQEGGSLHKRGG